MSGRHTMFAGLSKPQIAALGNVAFGGTGAGVPRKTMAKLLERNLIVPIVRSSSDILGRFTWTEYAMPIDVHVRFCEFCETLPND